MAFRSCLGAIVALGVVAASTATVQAQPARVFQHPRIGANLLDGCYSWPGPCRSRRQANAFCREQGYSGADDFEVRKKAGGFQTWRLGDEGVCTFACSVMVWVACGD